MSRKCPGRALRPTDAGRPTADRVMRESVSAWINRTYESFEDPPDGLAPTTQIHVKVSGSCDPAGQESDAHEEVAVVLKIQVRYRWSATAPCSSSTEAVVMTGCNAL